MISDDRYQTGLRITGDSSAVGDVSQGPCSNSSSSSMCTVAELKSSGREFNRIDMKLL
jgi:hypothetical protein